MPVIPGYSSPTASFEVPLEMLAACHGRITQQCASLRRLVAYLAEKPVDAEVSSAAAAILRYFDTAAAHHHADEELDMFPALLEAGAGSDAVCIRELTAALIAEHRLLEQYWQAIRPVLAHLAAGDSATLDAATVMALIELYETHMQREEAEVLPLAARLLSTAALDRVGRAMRERRGVVLPD